jgi:hypothetical protein
MLRKPLPLLSLALTAAAAVALAACGSENAKLLPGQTAREITVNLDTVKQLAGEGDCVGAESAAEQVGEQIEALEGVDHKLKRALEEGAARLEEVVGGCEESSSEAIAPAVVPSEPEEGEEEKAPKGKEKEEGEAKGKEEEVKEPPPPPQPKGEAKGPENGSGPPATEEAPEESSEGPSGGVGPGAPAGAGG